MKAAPKEQVQGSSRYKYYLLFVAHTRGLSISKPKKPLFTRGISAQKGQVVIVGANLLIWAAGKKNRPETSKNQSTKWCWKCQNSLGRAADGTSGDLGFLKLKLYSWFSPSNAFPAVAAEKAPIKLEPSGVIYLCRLTNKRFPCESHRCRSFNRNITTLEPTYLNDEAFSALMILWLCNFKLRFYNFKLSANTKNLSGRRS